MKTFLFAVLAFGLLSLKAPQELLVENDFWKIVHNGKLLLKSSSENPEKNKAIIKGIDLKKSGLFEVTYTEQEKEKGWKRVIAFADGDNILYEKDGSYLKLTNTFLYSISKEVGTLEIYTWALPTDPKVAATVRVRRVHLCTIVFK